ncbi:Imm32 family immunity protein [Pasteurella atlantica]|uniref:Imm32 family immunity protein n=1 Tax=Pasteurellaceae TaxID=712 RepID=UPI0027441550|nr:Imm32 family immunity protein [Pasteurella atlantica]MDP8100101.1 Imm32 family immunity protein [Pasteurella atlantica]MDP8106228.1 Imm32 family immunity protein [Pasteurella atlantica]MDP8115957.1 Imm32 family immunity protein [Pasteurella atlantica]
MLTFEIDKENELVEIHGDKQGLKELANILTNLSEESEHVHLMSYDWGGEELDSEPQCMENELVHHVKIMFWNK